MKTMEQPWFGGLRRPAVFIFTGIVAVVLLIPLVSVVWSSRSDPLLGAYIAQLQSTTFRGTLFRSLGFAFITTVATLAIGYPVAYALTLVSNRMRTILLAAFVIPQISSLLVRTYAWMAILGVQGPVIDLTQKLGFEQRSWVGTSVGVVVVLVHYFLPFVILTVWGSMRAISGDHVRAATSMGATRVEAFWSVFVPQSKAGVIAGSLFVFVITAAMFAIPSLLGGTDDTTVSMLVVRQTVTGFSTDTASPAAQATLLAIVVLTIVGLVLRRVGLSTLIGVSDSALGDGDFGKRSDRRDRGLKISFRRRALTWIPESRRATHVTVALATTFALAITLVPFAYLFLISFQPLPLLSVPTHDFSTVWYDRVAADGTWLDVTVLSLKIGVVATGMALVAGWYLASRAARATRRTATLITGLACVPLVIPAVTYGQGLFVLLADLDLVGNWIAIAFAHAIVILPYTYINLLSGFSSYDQRLDEAAASLGAGQFRALRTVRIPILFPFVLTGALLAFLFSFDEFTVTRFLTGITVETLPVKFYGAAQQNLNPELAAVGSLIVCGLLVICAVAAVLMRLVRARTYQGKEAR